MIVEDISNDGNSEGFTCNIKLTHVESEAIMYSLMRTHCSGDELTISIELEDKIFEVIKKNR